MDVQQIVIKENDYTALEEFFASANHKKILLVCGNSIKKLQIGEHIKRIESKLGIEFIRFTEFEPNPRYESVVKGVSVFHESECEAILAIGGGSAMDVAKCIKLFCKMPVNVNYLQEEIVPNDVKLYAVPTTAGTGSEATRFAVIYYEGEKQSVMDYSCIPSMVVFDSSTLTSLSDYQRKATMLDAFCHAIESFWSVNSTEQSREYAAGAIRKIVDNMDSYMANEDTGNAEMLEASNIAGQAINISQTTAGHAMCYKLTSLYGLAHGHAAALCVSKIWRYMISHTAACTDPRGEEYLKRILSNIATAFGCENALEAADTFDELLKRLDLSVPHASDAEYLVLKKSVNPLRLKNMPILLDENTIDALYHEILRKEGE
ncbi:MAG: phosphonoacetaldehyde reductase [Hespellia sp.]|nr:phosphonoacetaldehyde reductase [Hespellia sp.]